jgi:hypothetical protein
MRVVGAVQRGFCSRYRRLLVHSGLRRCDLVCVLD